MRIQLNKLGLELEDFTEGITDFGKSKNGYLHSSLYQVWTKRNDFSIAAYVCPSCGSELFAKWVWYEIDTCFFNDWRYDSSDPAIKREFQDVMSKLITAKEKYIEHKKTIDSEMDSIASLAICPICGGMLSHVAGYYIKRREKSINHVFQTMRAERQSTEQKVAKHQVDRIAARFVATTSTLPQHSGTYTIKSNSEHLKEYLHKLIKNETNIYALAQRLETLYYSRFETNRAAYQSQISLLDSAKNKVDLANDYYKQCVAELNTVAQQKPEIVSLPKPAEPLKPVPPVMETPGLFNKKRVLASNAARTETYQEKCVQYEADIVAYRQKLIDIEAEENRQTQINKEHMEAAQRLALEKADAAKRALDQAQEAYEQVKLSAKDLPTPAKASKILLDNEIQIGEKCYKDLLKCRTSLYSYNIVFEKYRNVVALSTFYEYLMSGRCDTLEGTNGAYNLYESEIRSNLIISQLSQVLVSLDQIQHSQQVIYSELRSIGTSLKQLEYTMDRATKSIGAILSTAQNMEQYMEHISHNSDVIAHNSAVSAYYSKVNAELTNALGYMVAFN